MENIISNDDRVAIAEVDYIIHHMNERYLNKIPQKIRDYITILKKKNVEIYVDPKQPLEKQGLKEFTLYFLMILNLKYWCNDERRKDILTMMEQNQKKYDDKINNIFGQANSVNSVSGNEVASSRPRQVTTVGTDNPQTEVVEEQPIVNVIEELQNEEQSIIAASKENIFVKIINKKKELLIRK